MRNNGLDYEDLKEMLAEEKRRYLEEGANRLITLHRLTFKLGFSVREAEEEVRLWDLEKNNDCHS